MQTQPINGTATLPQREAVDEDTLLTSKQVRARVGNVSDMCIWRWMRDDRVQFPKPMQMNRRNYWRLGDLRRWQAERAEQQKVAA